MSIPEISQADTPANLPSKLTAPNNRYIVVKVGDRLVTFPDVLVSEIMIIERNTILALPFYETAIVGVIHHQANIMPLLLLRLLMGEQRALITESLTVVRLSKVADDLAGNLVGNLAGNLGGKNLSGVGLIVDRVIGSLTTDEYQDRYLLDSPKKVHQTVANIQENEYTPIEIILSSIPTHIWQPQRWQLSS